MWMRYSIRHREARIVNNQLEETYMVSHSYNRKIDLLEAVTQLLTQGLPPPRLKEAIRNLKKQRALSRPAIG